jgi:prepilin-type processing-associated H-X9-DG protein
MYNCGWLKTLWQHGYLKNKKLFYCPSQALTGNYKVFPSTFKVTYGEIDPVKLKIYFRPAGSNDSFTNFKKAKNTSIIPLGGDSYCSAGAYIDNQYYYISIKSTATGRVHTRHGGRANFMYGDGHVAAVLPGKLRSDYIAASKVSADTQFFYYTEKYSSAVAP